MMSETQANDISRIQSSVVEKEDARIKNFLNTARSFRDLHQQFWQEEDPKKQEILDDKSFNLFQRCEMQIEKDPISRYTKFFSRNEETGELQIAPEREWDFDFINKVVRRGNTEDIRDVNYFLMSKIKHTRYTYENIKESTHISFNSNSSNEPFENEYTKDIESFLPTILSNAKILIENSNRDGIDDIYRFLHENRDFIKQDIAHNLLSTPLNSPSAIKENLRGYTNFFGIISAVDFLAKKINTKEVNQATQKQFKYMYSLINGTNEHNIFDSLSKIYNSINFEDYDLNNKEFTQYEINLLLSNNILPKDKKTLDIAAGTGRHVVPLQSLGYNINAIDIEQKHVNLIKEVDPSINVVQSNWKELPFSNESIDSFYCLGRSILHNRTTYDYLLFFDELSRVCKHGATGIIDFPEIKGLYLRLENDLKKNLTNLDLGFKDYSVIFDGPQADTNFNRKLLSSQQINAVGNLFGFKVEKIENKQVSKDITNAYYKFTKLPEYNPNLIDRVKATELMDILKISHDIDYNHIFQAWGMGLGHLYLYGLNNENIRDLIHTGRTPFVSVKENNGSIEISATTSAKSLN